VVHLKKISSARPEHNFWQILVVCTGKEFLEKGVDLIASAEINSPDLRLVVAISDGDVTARQALEVLKDSLYNTTLYEAVLSHDEIVKRRRSLKLYVAKSLLEMSRIPTLVLNANSFIRRDLCLLPVELQKCDVALKLRFNRKKRSERVFLNTFWLQPNDRTYAYLDEACAALNRKNSDTHAAEKTAAYISLSRCRSFLKLAPLPSRYVDRDHEDGSYIWSGPPNGVKESEHALAFKARTRDRFGTVPSQIVIHPKQDIGTKSKLENNTFKRRVQRLGRPGRIYWRHMARLLCELGWSNGVPSRVVAVPQWEITPGLIESFSSANTVFVPHLIRRQLDHPKARYYMQELLSMLFTVDDNGWGSASKLYQKNTFLNFPLDDRLPALIEQITSGRITKAPQKGNSDISEFDILAPLQVPGDDALIHHANVDLKEFVHVLADFAHARRLRLVFRRHPYDETTFFEEMRARYQSEFVQFSPGDGHIHDFIRSAPIVAVINSGVGFEALMFNKPVLSFGKAIYDSVVTPVGRDNLEHCYERALNEDAEVRKKRYEQFISWYVYAAAIKVDEPVINLAADRLSDPVFGPNPVARDVQLDQDRNLRGLKLVKAPKMSHLQQLRVEFAYGKRRFEKLSNITVRRAKKKTINSLKARVTGTLLSPLDAEYFAGRRVALVGNASSLLASNMGAEIDAHDIVIRMNLGYPLILARSVNEDLVPPELVYGHFVDAKSSGNERLTVLRPDIADDDARKYTNFNAIGRRTDVWSCSTSDKHRQRFFAPLFDCVTVAAHPSYHHLSLRLLASKRVKALPSSIYMEFIRQHSAEPTSGLLWIEYLRRTNLAELTLYGFDFFESGHAVRATPNVLEVTGKWPHDPATERRYVYENVLASDQRVQLATRAPLSALGT
jgi:hypothetical protein